MQPTLLELFAGGGLAGVGLRAAGFKPIGAVEYDADIAAVYAQNLGAHVQVASVCDVDYRPFAGVTLAHASPVCTRASVANANGGEEALDLAAADAVCRMLREARPLWFTMENVWGYREFESYRNIVRELMALGYQWRVEHVNAANYGVPQTRKRLILRARRDGRNVGPLPQTHCQGGRQAGFLDEGLSPWVGWYAAIEDLLDTLPESKFADWQLKRLPEHLKSCLVKSKNANQQFGDGRREVDEPATTVVAYGSAAHRPKALLVPGVLSGCDIPRQAHEPSSCVVGCSKTASPKAWLLEGKPLNYAGSLAVTVGLSPAPTVTASEPRHPKRALLIDGDGNRSREPTMLEAVDPSMTVQAWHGRRPVQMPRAWQETGRVVAMTPRALARFQSVPDTYELPEKNSLACKIIGNGVPCLLAQHIGESFLQ